ncbi:unnamed protein product [Auanema sp. JU1783]|nr:unnamed protein product [Auanema sp. JU1783]
MSLDQTLDNLNSTLTRIAGLLHTVEIAIIIVAVALAILMIGSVATCYYDKYKKYHQLPVDNTNPSYERSSFHYKNVNETA